MNAYYYNLAFGKRPEKEPECLNNLAQDESYRLLMEELDGKLMKKLVETQDPRICTDPDYFEQFPYVGDDRHSWKALQEHRWSRQPF